MNTSDDGKALIKHFEQCRLNAYPDPKTGGAPWTCGWGSTRGITRDTVWTQEESDRNFAWDIGDTEVVVCKYVTHAMTQGQWDAFVSLFYNVGAGNQFRDGIAHLHPDGRPSTLLHAFNDGDMAKCEQQWLLWCSPGSNMEHGLRIRRMCELAMFRGEPWRSALP